jgi:hypothetical protein
MRADQAEEALAARTDELGRYMMALNTPVSATARTEPTDEMLDAGADAFLQTKEKHGAHCPLMLTLHAAYTAMVATDKTASDKEQG